MSKHILKYFQGPTTGLFHHPSNFICLTHAAKQNVLRILLKYILFFDIIRHILNVTRGVLISHINNKITYLQLTKQLLKSAIRASRKKRGSSCFSAANVS